MGKRKTAQDIGYVKERYPEVALHLSDFKGEGGRATRDPVDFCLIT